MSHITVAWTAVRFDAHHPQNTPEVQSWAGSGLPVPRDMSWGFVAYATGPATRQHVHSGDYIVEFQRGDYRVMSPETYQQWRAEGSNYISRLTWDIWMVRKQAR